jgi:hypothetical protein
MWIFRNQQQSQIRFWAPHIWLHQFCCSIQFCVTLTIFACHSSLLLLLVLMMLIFAIVVVNIYFPCCCCVVDDVDFVVLMMMMMMMLILLLLLGRRPASTVWVLASSSHVELLVLEF